jgi:KUP system potassium uptake protein
VVIGLKAFQGHPEAARAWDRHSDKFLKEIGFVPTTHEPCLYSGIFDGERVLFLRQVDDFAIAASNEQVANDILDKIDEFLTFPIKRLGLLKLFNGVDIDQTSEYIKISVVSYLTKIMEKYLDAETGFMSEPDQYPLAPQATPLPTRKRFIESFLSADGDRNKDGTPDMSYQRKMQKQLKISYRSAIGEIIWAMTTCRPDVSHAVVKAAQFSSCPHEIHYHGVRHILKYLNKTKDEGITFWRATKRTDLPDAPRPTIISDKRELFQDKRREFGPMELNAQADSDWAHCPKTRRSFTGVIVRMAGGTIAWKTRLQEAVALSSAEAELMAATDAGKMILYIRSILWDLGIPQLAATVIGEDNDACTAIGNAQKTTPRTRHMDIRYRALSDWIESDLMVLERVDTAVNTSDHLTKILGRILFHRHNDYLLGHVPPKYTQAYYELFHPMMQATTQDNINNSYETPHNVTDVGDKVVKSLIAQWNLLCHLVEI